MKKLSIIDKIVAIVNSILAAILLFSYLSYYISPNTYSFISLISLSIPFLILFNLLFVIYWLLKLKKQFLISLIVLVIGYQYLTKFYKFSEKKIILNSDVKLMSYNVRMFNLYNWINEKNVAENIYEFINEKEPDILCIQEFDPNAKVGFKYPYKFVKISKKNKQFGHAIFSKFKIVNSGSINFSNSSNTAIFADIIKNTDTIRVYNIHLESLKINPNDEYFNSENSQKFKLRVESAFKKQANQAVLILQHQQNSHYKSIMCGDFNNTAFSWVYHKLKTNKNDAFEIAGKGFGKTFNTKFPLRIDFILVDEQIEVTNFKTFDVTFSDHYPVMARLSF